MYQTIEETEPQDELFPYNYMHLSVIRSYNCPTKIHKEDTSIGTKETWKMDLKIGAILRGIEDALKDIMHKLSISVIYSYSCHVKTPKARL